MNLPTTPDGLVTRMAVARAARGLSCASLGEAVGVTAAQVSCWERGVSEPSPAQRCAVALRLGWPIRDLVLPPLAEGEAWSVAVKAHNLMVLGLRPVSRARL